MKKLIVFLVLFLCLIGCKKDYNTPYNIETYVPDMSVYEGLDNENSCFVGTTVEQLQKLIEEKGYGVFVFSRSNCAHCQITMQYLNEVANELEVQVFYIDGMSNEYPILNTDYYQVFFDILYDYLAIGENGPEIQTPHVFTIIDGEITSSKVGTTWNGLEYDEEDVKELKTLYKDMLSPFKK